MGWFFRVIELADGRWACRHGLTEFDGHAVLHDAVAHMTTLASREADAELFLHYLDGTVERVGDAGGLRDTEPPAATA